MQEDPHSLKLQFRVASFSSDLLQGTGIRLKRVQSANGILQSKQRKKYLKLAIFICYTSVFVHINITESDGPFTHEMTSINGSGYLGLAKCC